MNYLLLAGVVALAMMLGYIVGRTAEAVSRDRKSIENSAFAFWDNPEDAVYDHYEAEARKRGKGV